MPPGFSGIGVGETIFSVMLLFAAAGLVIGAALAALLVRKTAKRRWWWLWPATVATSVLLGFGLGSFFRWF